MFEVSKPRRASTDSIETRETLFISLCCAIDLGAQFIQIMIATSPNMSAVERSYSQLEMIAVKRHSHHSQENIGILFLLLVFKFSLKKAADYLEKRFLIRD